MSEIVQPQNAKTQDYSAYHRDGLLDIFIGLGLTSAGLAFLSGLFWMAGMYPAIILPLWQAGRKKNLKRMGVTNIPGSVKFQVRFVMLVALIVGVLLLFFTFGLLTFLQYEQIPAEIFAWLTKYYLLILAAFGAILFSVSAVLTGIRRLHGYALLMIVFSICSIWLDVNPGISISLLGMLIFTNGCWMLIRFWRDFHDA